jgi:hypothetical protein
MHICNGTSRTFRSLEGFLILPDNRHSLQIPKCAVGQDARAMLNLSPTVLSWQASNVRTVVSRFFPFFFSLLSLQYLNADFKSRHEDTVYLAFP